MSAVDVTQAFLAHVFAGQMPDALALVAEEAAFIGANPVPSPANPLFGTHHGPEGAAQFFARFAALLEPGGFEIDAAFGTDSQACLHGRFRHQVRATGRPFASDWALVTRVAAGKLTFYHFYEDTAALTAALA